LKNNLPGEAYREEILYSVLIGKQKSSPDKSEELSLFYLSPVQGI